MQIKECIHLYLGSNVLTSTGVARFVDIRLLGNNEQQYLKLYPGESITKPLNLEEDKLILRSVLSLSNDEMFEFAALFVNDQFSGYSIEVISQLKSAQYLYKKSIDIYGLIESGQAVDATKI